MADPQLHDSHQTCEFNCGAFPHLLGCSPNEDDDVCCWAWPPTENNPQKENNGWAFPIEIKRCMRKKVYWNGVSGTLVPPICGEIYKRKEKKGIPFLSRRRFPGWEFVARRGKVSFAFVTSLFVLIVLTCPLCRPRQTTTITTRTRQRQRKTKWIFPGFVLDGRRMMIGRSRRGEFPRFFAWL